jgi:hypothetical protein
MELVRIEIADGTVKTAPWTDRDENGLDTARQKSMKNYEIMVK